MLRVNPNCERLTDATFRGTVDVIIPVRDGMKTISAALSSALRQTAPPRRIIVVDDGSKDETASVVARMGSGLVEYARTPPTNISRTRNTGIRLSRAEFIAFLDADDLWHPDKLRRQLEVFAKHQDATLVYCGSAIRRPSGAIVDLVAPTLKGFVLQELLAGGSTGNPSCLVVKREALLQIGGFDETVVYGQDTDLLLRLATRYRFYFADDFLVDVIQNPESVSRRRSGTETLSESQAHMEFLLARIAVYERWCQDYEISFRVVQAFRKQITAAAVRRRYGWSWMLLLRAQLLGRSPRMGRKIWGNHAIFAGCVILATLAYPFRLLARKLKVECYRSRSARYVLALLRSVRFPRPSAFRRFAIFFADALGVGAQIIPPYATRPGSGLTSSTEAVEMNKPRAPVYLDTREQKTERKRSSFALERSAQHSPSRQRAPYRNDPRTTETRLGTPQRCVRAQYSHSGDA